MHATFEALMIAGLFFCVQSVYAQERTYTVEPISDHLYELSYPAEGYVVKVIASVGDDGILLVDTGVRQKAEALKSLLQERWHATPKVIIISHEHIEHIGGTEIFGTEPTVIGHTTLRSVLTSRHFLFEEFTDATFPDITVSDSHSLVFNGEEIKVISVAGGHSGSDLIVWFTGSGVAYVDGLCNWPHFPSIDNTSGDVALYCDAVKRVIDLLPKDTKIISGHGNNCSMLEFKQFHDMLTQTRDIVLSGLAAGKTVEDLQKEDVLKNYKGYEGGYVSADQWIEYLARIVQGNPTHDKKSMYEVIYYTLKEKGLDSAVARFSELKRDHANEYDFDETTPTIIGYLLFHRDKFPEAIAFLQLGLREYPQGPYVGLSYDYLGRSFEKLNNREQALMNYRKASELDPADTTVARKITELENK